LRAKVTSAATTHFANSPQVLYSIARVLSDGGLESAFGRQGRGNMRIRHFAIASALSLAALVSTAPNALAQQAEAMKYCRADVARLCPGVPMGGGRIIACLKGHKEEMSIGCGKALQAMKAKMGN
jgi:hypothetical protein